MNDSIIRVEHLSKSFQKEQILKDISCEFECGKIHAVVGNNGSGKSVFFKCICGFLAPSEGKVVVNHKVIGQDVDFPESTGILIERPGFLEHLSGYENLKLLAQIRGKVAKQEIFDTITRVGLDPASKKAVGKYSLGMKQRLGIAQALMEKPDLLILDEPFNGLDKEGVQNMRELLMTWAEEGKSLMFASHNSSDIRVLADQVWEMDAGRLVKV